MGKFSILLFLVLLLALGLFAMENKGTFVVKVPFGNLYEVSKTALMVFTTITGALVILFIFFVRDTKRIIDNLQAQKRQRRDERIEAFYAKALNAVLGNKDEEAKDALGSILKEDPEHVEALLRMGDIAFGNEDYKTALEYYKKVKDINPANLQALLSMETVFERMKRSDDALRYTEEILDLDAENLTALCRKRALLEAKEEWDSLLSLQKTIIKLEQNEKERQKEEHRLLGYKYEYARASLENAHLEKAEKAFRTLLKMDSTFIPAYLGLAEVMLTKGEAEEAINFLEKGYEQLSSVILLARLEDLLISVGEPGRLIRIYKNAMARSPQDNRLKFLLGKLYYRLEMVDDALEMLNTIDASAFSIPEFYSLRGELYLKRKQTAQAVEELRRACGIRQSLIIPYCCTNCGLKAADWSGRCPGCKEWNTYRLDFYGTCKA